MTESNRPLPETEPGDGHQPVFNAPRGVTWTCIALVACHVLYSLAGPAWQYAALRRLAFVPAFFLGDVPGETPGAVVTLVTHAFLQADSLHLFLNAGFLLAFGSLVERRAGTLRFLLIFVGCAAAGALAQAVATGPELVPMIGASGAVYGMIGAAMPHLFAGHLERRRRRMLAFAGVLMALNLLFGLAGIGDLLAGAAIAWQAHIGGFVVGLLLGLLPARGERG